MDIVRFRPSKINQLSKEKEQIQKKTIFIRSFFPYLSSIYDDSYKFHPIIAIFREQWSFQFTNSGLDFFRRKQIDRTNLSETDRFHCQKNRNIEFVLAD